MQLFKTVYVVIFNFSPLSIYALRFSSEDLFICRQMLLSGSIHVHDHSGQILEMLYYAISILELNHVKPSQMATNYKLQISLSPGCPSGVWGMEGLGRGDG